MLMLIDLVDCGSGVTQRMAAAGASGAALDALLLTHLHSDHLVDLYQLVISSWHQGRDRPQRMFGPAGTSAFAAATMEVWRQERELRIAWELRPSTAGLEIDVTEVEEGVIWDADGLRISAFAVDHRPVAPAFGFLFETAEARVAFSGDTTVCERLIEAAAGVDVLVHECFIHRALGPGRMRSAQGMAISNARHMPAVAMARVSRVACQSNCRKDASWAGGQKPARKPPITLALSARNSAVRSSSLSDRPGHSSASASRVNSSRGRAAGSRGRLFISSAE